MSHSKKYQSSWRCSIFDISLGVFIIFFPLILLNNFLWAFSYIFLLSSISSLNAISITKKNTHFSFTTSLNTFDDSKNERVKKIVRKEFSLLKSITISLCSVITYYVLCILFGAPLFELYTSTLYFSCLMTVLTVYPLLWYFYSCDSLSTVIRIFADLKSDNLAESHFYCFAMCSIIGAWVGAFPIPLDWDRPWQAWPITCCIGASLGYGLAHFFMGGKVLHTLVKEKRKSTSSRSV